MTEEGKKLVQERINFMKTEIKELKWVLNLIDQYSYIELVETAIRRRIKAFKTQIESDKKELEEKNER